jgi:hypothetical protein
MPPAVSIAENRCQILDAPESRYYQKNSLETGSTFPDMNR